ncbi:MAG TPA: dihydrodipicolinate synthase family protein [Armatimonadota bacterium]|jgi:dihydrodipicolinate synthase/N-acetylneuraminate lyase
MDLRAHLLDGQVIPAHPLALTAERKLDERRQCALTRYYVDAGAGGLAVGVHSTQFAIREPRYGLFEPVLQIASETIDASLAEAPRPFIKVAGVCGRTQQAVKEAVTARLLGYDAGLLSLAAFADEPADDVLAHCRTVAGEIPVLGFYLQPAVGGREYPYSFWRRFAEIENVIAIKIAPFNRYQTLDVVRAVAEAGRDDIALYTGNDDNIIADLLTRFPFGGRTIAGGLLGQWAVWTHRAVGIHAEVKAARAGNSLDAEWLTTAAAYTDANAAIFDAAHAFQGCIPGIHEVLRRQGLMAGTWCLDPDECLSPGQADEISRVCAAYPYLTDDNFVAEHVDRWMG